MKRGLGRAISVAALLVGLMGARVLADPAPPSTPPVAPPAVTMPDDRLRSSGGQDGVDGLIWPGPEGLPPASYDEPIGSYDMILTCSTWCPGEATINALAEALFKAAAFIVKISIRLMETAFSLNLFSYFAPWVQGVVNDLASGVLYPLFPLIGTVIGGLLMWRAGVLRSLVTSVSLITVTGALLAGAAFSLAHIGTFLNWANDFSAEVSGRVLTAGMKLDPRLAVSSGDPPGLAAAKAVRVGGDRIWLTGIHRPWALANFGSMRAAEKYQGSTGLPGGEVLHMTAKEREQFYKEHDGKNNPDLDSWDGGSAGSRLLMGLILLVVSIIAYLLPFALLAMAVLALQLIALLWACLTPMAFLFALVPSWGPRVVESWFKHLTGVFLFKIGLAFLLAIVLSMMNSLSIFALDVVGVWQLAPFMHLALLVGLFLYRHSLFGWLSTSVGGIQTPGWLRTAVVGGVAGYVGARVAGSVKAARDWRDERQMRDMAMKNLDRKAMTSRRYQSRVMHRVQTGKAGREGLLRHDARDVQKEINRLRAVREAGGNLQAELQPRFAKTTSAAEHAASLRKFDEDLAAFRTDLAGQAKQGHLRTQVAARDQSKLGRVVNRLSGHNVSKAEVKPLVIRGTGRRTPRTGRTAGGSRQ